MDSFCIASLSRSKYWNFPCSYDLTTLQVESLFPALKQALKRLTSHLERFYPDIMMIHSFPLFKRKMTFEPIRFFSSYPSKPPGSEQRMYSNRRWLYDNDSRKCIDPTLDNADAEPGRDGTKTARF